MTARKYGGERLLAMARVRQSQQLVGGLPALSAEDLGLDALVSQQEVITGATTGVLHYTGSGEMGELAGLLPRSLVLHGDGSDPELLRSRIEKGQIDAVMVLLEDPEKSVLIRIFAKSLGALIAAVIRGGDVFIPSGSTVLRPGDDLLVVCRPEALGQIEKLLA